jgi:hypothetical protein
MGKPAPTNTYIHRYKEGSVTSMKASRIMAKLRSKGKEGEDYYK